MLKKIVALILGIMMLLSAAAVAENDLHIADDVTLRFWFPLSLSSDVPGMTDYNDSDAYAWLEEQTGIHIEWLHPASGTDRESFNLLYASDDMPDLIYNSIANNYVYSAGPDMAIADGVYVNLAEYEHLMPNYMAIINSNEALKRESVTDDGNRWCFFYMYKGGRGPNFGPTIRQDFLDKLNMKRPETYEEWHTVLKAFKEELGIEIPLYVSKDTFMWYSEFAAGYGVTRDWSLDVDGQTVLYGPMQDGYGEYLDMMKQWYEEGLIDQSFSIHEGKWPEDDLILNDKVGAFPSYTSWTGTEYYAKRGATNPEFNLVGTKIPVKEGGEAHYRMPDMITNTMCVAISATSDHIEEAIRWMDAQYSEAAAFVLNYGVVEGEEGSYYIDEEGPHWGGLITRNPDGLTQSQARKRFTTNNAPYEDYNRVMGMWSDSQKETQQLIMASDAKGYISDSITMTESEQEEFSDIMSDVTTFVEEFTVNYVMGNATQTFDEFRAQLKSMDIECALEIKQAAVNRYNER